jgi:hypothetical protein
MVNQSFITSTGTPPAVYQKKFSLALLNWQLLLEEEKSVKGKKK